MPASASSVPARGWVFMGLLALQFGLQPLFSKANVSPSADKVPLVLLCELLKLLSSDAMLLGLRLPLLRCFFICSRLGLLLHSQRLLH